MAERHEELYNTGQISTRALNKTLAKTRPNPGFQKREEAGKNRKVFVDKQGLKDQGMHKDDGAVGNEELEGRATQKTGAKFLPSEGGKANMKGRFPHSDEISEAERQKPEMPRGAGVTGRKSTASTFKRSDGRTGQKRGDNNSKGSWSKPRKLAGTKADSPNTGNYYGGHNNRTTG